MHCAKPPVWRIFHIVSLGNLLKKIYQKEIQQIICLIKNAQGMAQFTKLSIRLSLRHCDSINLQLSSARATTLLNHRVRSLTLCRSCTNGKYLFSSFSRSLSLSSSLSLALSLGSLDLARCDLNAVHESTFLLPSRNCFDFPYLSYYSYSCHACWSQLISLSLIVASARFPSLSLALLLGDRQCEKDTWRSWRVMDVTAGFLFALSAAQGAKLYPLN